MSREHKPYKDAPTSSQLVEEVPVAITVNDLHYSVMLASPHNLGDFAIGYLLAEGLITDHNQVHDFESTPLAQGLCLNIQLSNQQTNKFKQQQRRIKGTSGCGLCGKEAMQFAFPDLQKLPITEPLSRSTIEQLKPQLSKWQRLAKHSGAMHAAFWIDAQGTIIACREDIGRHNAVDKVIGHALRKRLPTTQASLLVTSRCSVEIVQKAIIAKLGSLISLASPTQLALEFAQANHLNLIHIPRKDSPMLLTPGDFQ